MKAPCNLLLALILSVCYCTTIISEAKTIRFATDPSPLAFGEAAGELGVVAQAPFPVRGAGFAAAAFQAFQGVVGGEAGAVNLRRYSDSPRSARSNHDRASALFCSIP